MQASLLVTDARRTIAVALFSSRLRPATRSVLLSPHDVTAGSAPRRCFPGQFGCAITLSRARPGDGEAARDSDSGESAIREPELQRIGDRESGTRKSGQPEDEQPSNYCPVCSERLAATTVQAALPCRAGITCPVRTTYDRDRASEARAALRYRGWPRDRQKQPARNTEVNSERRLDRGTEDQQSRSGWSVGPGA